MRTKSALTASDAQTIAAACRTEAAKNGWGVSIVVVDDGGNLMHIERLDGASILSVDIAIAKARTSALTRRPSKFWEDRVGQSSVYLKFPHIMPLQGGLPVMHAGECVGGVGIAGRPQASEDEQVATAGVAALG